MQRHVSYTIETSHGKMLTNAKILSICLGFTICYWAFKDKCLNNHRSIVMAQPLPRSLLNACQHYKGTQLHTNFPVSTPPLATNEASSHAMFTSMTIGDVLEA